jgi:hypothetical protein
MFLLFILLYCRSFLRITFSKIIILAIRNKETALSEMGPPFSQIFPLQLFDFYVLFNIRCI